MRPLSYARHRVTGSRYRAMHHCAEPRNLLMPSRRGVQLILSALRLNGRRTDRYK